MRAFGSVLAVACFFLATMTWAKNIAVKIGDETVIIHQEQNGSGQSFIHLHQNETTALKAARAVLQKQGGTLLTLIHKGQRCIVFHLGNHRYEFDPNRIFSDVGIKKTLRQYGAYSTAAHYEVKKLATKIKQSIPEGKIIAVHNNRSYSLKDYLPGNALAADSAALSFPDKGQFRNFYLVTTPEDFKRIKAAKFNGVLQANKATDDGSLSVCFSHREYINVEAGFDQLTKQIKMLRFA